MRANSVQDSHGAMRSVRARECIVCARARLLSLLLLRHVRRRRVQNHLCLYYKITDVGSGSRSEKIRTYNWKDSRVSDHRIGANFSLQNFLDGDIKAAIGGMQALEQEEKLAALNAEMSGK